MSDTPIYIPKEHQEAYQFIVDEDWAVEDTFDVGCVAMVATDFANKNTASLRERLQAAEKRVVEMEDSKSSIHRRCQQAEAAVVDAQKIIDKLSNGKDIYVQGSFGRALLRWHNSQQAERIAELERELGAADQYAFDNLTDLNCYPHGVLGGEIVDELG